MSRSSPGRREDPAQGQEQGGGIQPRYRRAFGCVTWVYMSVLVFLAAATLFAVPLRYSGEGAGFGQILSLLSFFGLVLILPAMALAAALGARTYRVERRLATRAGAGVGAIVGWTSFFVLIWSGIALSLDRRDQLFRPVLFAGLEGSFAYYLLPLLALLATGLVLYALFSRRADFERRGLLLLGGALAALAGLVVVATDPDPVGIFGALVSTAAGAAGGWVAGIGYARAGGNEMIPPGSTIRPREPRRKPR